MAVTTAVLRAACNTTTGNQDFTTADFGGGTPKSAILIVSGSTTDGTEAQQTFWLGGYDGTTQGGYYFAGKDNTNTSDGRRGSTHGEIAAKRFQGSGDFTGTMSFITNGVRINWSDAPNAAYLLTVILFGGTDFSGHQHNFGSIAAAGTETATTSFQPHIIIAMGGSGIEWNSGSNGHCSGAFGVYDWDGGTSPFNAAIGFVYPEAVGTSQSATQYSTTDIIAMPNITTQAADLYLDVSAITSTSYTIQNNAAATTHINLCGHAINVGARGYKAWEQASPTATGNWSVTGVGFKPQMVIGFLSHSTATGIISSGAAAGNDAISVFTPNAEFCNTNMFEDGQASAMRAKGLSDNTAINMPTADGTASYVASFVSMDTDGFTLNFSAANGTSHKWVFIAIEEEPAGDTSTLALGTMTPFGIDVTVTLTQAQWSNLVQGTETVTGFAPTVTLTQGDESILVQGAATAIGFDPTVTLTQDATTTLAQGTATSAGFDPTVTLTQNAITTLAQGASTSTGFAPTVTLLEGDQTTLVQGVSTAATFDPTVTLTQDATSTLAQGSSTATGFGPTVTVGAGEISNLVAGAATAATFTPTVTLTQNLVSTLASGTFIVNGLVPTIEVTGIAPAVKRRGGAGGAKKKRKHYRRVMIAGIVYKVSSAEEELALWKAHLMKVREETPGRLGEIEARSIEQKIRVVEKRVEAKKARPRRREELLVKYVAARRKIVRAKIQELLESLR